MEEGQVWAALILLMKQRKKREYRFLGEAINFLRVHGVMRISGVKNLHYLEYGNWQYTEAEKTAMIKFCDYAISVLGDVKKRFEAELKKKTEQ